jgi:uncharacterized lipoprotein YajG
MSNRVLKITFENQRSCFLTESNLREILDSKIDYTIMMDAKTGELTTFKWNENED